MANEATITLTGNACADGELRFTQSGVAVAGVTVAVTPREKVGEEWKDGDAAFYRVTAWRQFGENVAESIRKGDRVTVVGRLKPREYEHNGVTRTSLDVDADTVALDLRFRPALTGDKPQQSQWRPVQQRPQQAAQPTQQGNGGGWGGGGSDDGAPPF